MALYKVTKQTWYKGGELYRDRENKLLYTTRDIMLKELGKSNYIDELTLRKKWFEQNKFEIIYRFFEKNKSFSNKFKNENLLRPSKIYYLEDGRFQPLKSTGDIERRGQDKSKEDRYMKVSLKYINDKCKLNFNKKIDLLKSLGKNLEKLKDKGIYVKKKTWENRKLKERRVDNFKYIEQISKSNERNYAFLSKMDENQEKIFINRIKVNTLINDFNKNFVLFDRKKDSDEKKIKNIKDTRWLYSRDNLGKLFDEKWDSFYSELKGYTLLVEGDDRLNKLVDKGSNYSLDSTKPNIVLTGIIEKFLKENRSFEGDNNLKEGVRRYYLNRQSNFLETLGVGDELKVRDKDVETPKEKYGYRMKDLYKEYIEENKKNLLEDDLNKFLGDYGLKDLSKEIKKLSKSKEDRVENIFKRVKDNYKERFERKYFEVEEDELEGPNGDEMRKRKFFISTIHKYILGRCKKIRKMDEKDSKDIDEVFGYGVLKKKLMIRLISRMTTWKKRRKKDSIGYSEMESHSGKLLNSLKKKLRPMLYETLEYSLFNLGEDRDYLGVASNYNQLHNKLEEKGHIELLNTFFIRNYILHYQNFYREDKLGSNIREFVSKYSEWRDLVEEESRGWRSKLKDYFGDEFVSNSVFKYIKKEKIKELLVEGRKYPVTKEIILPRFHRVYNYIKNNIHYTDKEVDEICNSLKSGKDEEKVKRIIDKNKVFTKEGYERAEKARREYEKFQRNNKNRNKIYNNETLKKIGEKIEFSRKAIVIIDEINKEGVEADREGALKYLYAMIYKDDLLGEENSKEELESYKRESMSRCGGDVDKVRGAERKFLSHVGMKFLRHIVMEKIPPSSVLREESLEDESVKELRKEIGKEIFIEEKEYTHISIFNDSILSLAYGISIDSQNELVQVFKRFKTQYDGLKKKYDKEIEEVFEDLLKGENILKRINFQDKIVEDITLEEFLNGIDELIHLLEKRIFIRNYEFNEKIKDGNTLRETIEKVSEKLFKDEGGNRLNLTYRMVDKNEGEKEVDVWGSSSVEEKSTIPRRFLLEEIERGTLNKQLEIHKSIFKELNLSYEDILKKITKYNSRVPDGDEIKAFAKKHKISIDYNENKIVVYQKLTKSLIEKIKKYQREEKKVDDEVRDLVEGYRKYYEKVKEYDFYYSLITLNILRRNKYIYSKVNKRFLTWAYQEEEFFKKAQNSTRELFGGLRDGLGEEIGGLRNKVAHLNFFQELRGNITTGVGERHSLLEMFDHFKVHNIYESKKYNEVVRVRENVLEDINVVEVDGELRSRGRVFTFEGVDVVEGQINNISDIECKYISKLFNGGYFLVR